MTAQEKRGDSYPLHYQARKDGLPVASFRLKTINERGSRLSFRFKGENT
jgi:hypothetical protein